LASRTVVEVRANSSPKSPTKDADDYRNSNLLWLKAIFYELTELNDGHEKGGDNKGARLKPSLWWRRISGATRVDDRRGQHRQHNDLMANIG